MTNSTNKKWMNSWSQVDVSTFTNDLGDTFSYLLVKDTAASDPDFQAQHRIETDGEERFDLLFDPERRYLDILSKFYRVNMDGNDLCVVRSMETNLGFSASEKHRKESLRQLCEHVFSKRGLLVVIPKDDMWTERAEMLGKQVLPESLNPGMQKFHENKNGATSRAEVIWIGLGNIGFSMVMDNELNVPKPCVMLVQPWVKKWSRRKSFLPVKNFPKNHLTPKLLATEAGENRYVAVER